MKCRALLERTQECEPKYYLSPYKRRNTGAASPKSMCVDFTMKHICTNFQRNPPRIVACTQDFHQNMTFDPIKDGTLGAVS